MNGKSLLSKQSKANKDSLFENLFKKPWPYWVGGVLLALLNIIYVVLTGDYWAITTNLARWGSWILSNLGIAANEWDVWTYYDYYARPWLDKQTWSNLGIVFGALIAILLAKQFKFKRVKNKKQVLIVLIGGWLMGYGARVAVGCNIGGLYSSISSLGLNGWLYLPFVMLGVFLGSKILMKWFT
ncbi:YeeE/YedE thiosulfate transporter family protein [Orenia marismortui]|uniref:Uncharacterized protein n=1 Tax=Orenia marismortui TaxID=46469 RepID=A0A4V6QB66_9FIRM|nr:YeeE/YedE thiosulfate transporter family protein [Orenia marismortui]TDX48349.1 hypothetical protein C7959_12910 [Orenia marismortui]